MSFLDNNGLAYFYDKLKSKFAQTVNGVAPTDGNISITNVATADNLTSNDGVEFYSNFIQRIAGGDADISNGDAYLMYIEGNSVVSDRVEEVVEPIGANGIVITVSDLPAWRNAITEAPSSGTIRFIYNKPIIPSTSISSSWTSSGTWKDSGNNNVDLNDYGLTATGVVNPAVSIQKSSSSFSSAFVVPYTFMNATSSVDNTEFVFDYDEELGSWLLNHQTITLNDYGLSISAGGVATTGDKITVTRINGTTTTAIDVKYQKPDRGIITNATPSQFAASGFNQFNKDSSDFYLSGYTISDGTIVPSTGKYVCYCRALAGSPSGYIAYSSGGYLISGAVGYCATIPSNGTQLTQTTEDWDKRDVYHASLMIEEDGYIAVAVNSKDDLCMHIRWDDEEDDVYEEYVAPSTITIPSTAKDDTSLPLASYGMPALGAIKDKLVMDSGTDEGTYIQKIERVAYTEIALQETINSGVAYDYDRNWIYRALTTPVNYTVTTHALYEVNDLGIEEFLGTTVPVWAENLYGENLRNKLKVNTLTISEQNPPLNNNQKHQVQENLGFISKNFGGELQAGQRITMHQMTNLGESPLSFVNTQYSAYTQSQRPSTTATQYLLGVSAKDLSGLGYIASRISPDGTSTMLFSSQTKINAETIKNNALFLGVTANGDCTVNVTDVNAWRKMLGLGDSNGALPITIAQGGTGATTAQDARINLDLEHVYSKQTIALGDFGTAAKTITLTSGSYQPCLIVTNGTSTARQGLYIVALRRTAAPAVTSVVSASGVTITAANGSITLSGTSTNTFGYLIPLTNGLPDIIKIT